MDWFKIWKGVQQAIYYHPVYLTYMEKISCEIERLGESQGGTKIAVTSDIQMIPL